MGFLRVLFNIYKLLVIIIGNGMIAILIIYGIMKIREFHIMKKSTKQFANALHKSNFIQDALGKMSEEEKETLAKNNKAESKVTLNFGDMSVKKETK